QALADWAARLPRNADAETLERLLQQERSIIEGLAADIAATGATLAQVLSGPAQTASDIAELGQRADDLAEPVAAAEGENPVLPTVRRAARASELRRVRAEIELRRLQQDTAIARQQLLELTIAELKNRQALHVARTERLQYEIADLGRRAIEALVARVALSRAEMARAEMARAEMARAEMARDEMTQEGGAPESGVLDTLLSRNETLGAELIAANEALVADRNALVANEAARELGAAALRESRARLELGSRNDEVGRWLWSERRRIPSETALQDQLDDARAALATVRLRLFGLGEDIRQLMNVPLAAERTLAEYAALSEEADETLPEAADLEPMLRDRAALLGLLKPLLERRLVALEQGDQALSERADTARELRALLDRHLLWIASHSPIDTAWLARIPVGLGDLLKPSRYLTSWTLVQLELRHHPVRWGLGLIALLAVLLLGRQAPARIAAEAALTRDPARDSFLATARSLLWTVLAALPVPAALAGVGGLLHMAGEPGRFTDSLGLAVLALVPAAAGLTLLRATAMERGLGHAHFRWVRPRRQALRAVVAPIAAIVLPACLLTRLAFNRNLELSNDVEARMAIVTATLAIGWALWYALAPHRVWNVRGQIVEPSRLRALLRLVLPAGLAVIAALALTGYVYSAGLLLQAVLATFTMVVGLVIVFGLVGRWLVLGEKRLRLKRRAEQAQGDLPAAESQAGNGEGAESEITILTINRQTGRLLRALRLTLFAAGILWVWVDLLPAFARLDEIALWTLTETGADGAPIDVPVTLMALLLGILALTLTAVGARNLPGLVEIILMSRTHIDAPTRYAITSLLRYAIVIAGALIGLGMLGMRWSQLQWLAAALTVGLGFGLQEIFANFVSGLILLFERPFRVGDVITVGELSGRVTRIRTRATTVVDFENREIVIPNKSFITGQLVNWTLSDNTTRVTIKLGVDYGTEPKQVLALLMQSAQEHPLVMADPAPQSWFMAFGANSLDFELRVFVASLDHRLVVQNDLNIRVAGLFEAHAINMAYPQLDVHIRDMPKP
ncbi:MAG: mechanosensitive ion channel domain-containing protein, partial [Gammaproteobacteria bacterium]